MQNISIDRTGRYPIIDNVCFTVEGYSAAQEVRDPYLGYNRGINKPPTVTLSAYFQENLDVEKLMDFWKIDLDEGQNIFMTQIEIFGKNDMYGLRQISPIVDVKPNGIHKLTLTCEVVFDSSSITNTPPVANDITVHVRKNSNDNFLTLLGSDKDGDPLSFEVQVGTGIGKLRGTGNNLYYTPDHDVDGVDCFSFIAKDYWANSAPAIATIIIDDYGMPDTEVEYTVTGGLAVSGNYFYDLGNGVWHRGTGGVITPINTTITIKSDDHKVNVGSKSHITAVTIVKWGDRTNWDELCSDSKTITQFGILGTAGVCHATSVVKMFHASGVKHVIGFDMSKVSDMSDFISYSDVTSMADMDLPLCEDVSKAFAHTPKLKYVGVLKTPNTKYFNECFAETPQLTCLGGIDTRKKVATTNMFVNSGLTNPNKTTEQGTILNGSLWLSKTVCLFQFATPTIIHVGETQDCHIAAVGDKCKSKGQYKVNLVHPAHTGSTYVWTSNVPITAGQGTDTVTVETGLSGSVVTIWVQCEITQGTAIANSGHAVFKHTRTADFLNLMLPVSYTPIDLRAFIDAHNPHNLKKVMITNNVRNCHVDTGDLTGFDVTLVNNGVLTGFPIDKSKIPNVNNSGLYLKTPMMLINNGRIFGAGGWGGKGAKGKNIAGVTTWSLASDRNENIMYKGNNNGHGGQFYSGCFKWKNATDHNNVAVQWFYRSNGAKYIQVNPNPVEPSTTFYEDNGNTRITLTRIGVELGLTDNPPKYTDVGGWQMNVKIYHKHVTPAKIGGAGGEGGIGLGFLQDHREPGKDGAPSKPKGGNNGYTGGRGGDWGTNGDKGGGTAGQGGGKHGIGIMGVARLKAGSKQGIVKGGVL